MCRVWQGRREGEPAQPVQPCVPLLPLQTWLWYLLRLLPAPPFLPSVLPAAWGTGPAPSSPPAPLPLSAGGQSSLPLPPSGVSLVSRSEHSLLSTNFYPVTVSVRNYHSLGLMPGLPGLSFGGSKRKKSWTRAVFSNLQRKGLEKRFQIQKYITKPDRRQLAASLGLTDAQVKDSLPWDEAQRSGDATVDIQISNRTNIPYFIEWVTVLLSEFHC